MESSSARRSTGAGWVLLVGLTFVALAILAIGGYLLGWTWTGFTGNTLWDWLTLLVLPVSLAAATTLFAGGRLRTPIWITLGVLVLAVLAVLAYGGYVLGWSWTGFQGNTVWDWLKLLLLPVVITGSSIRLTRPRSLAPA